MKNKTVLDLNKEEFYKTFLRNDFYINFSIPNYFYFNDILNKLWEKLPPLKWDNGICNFLKKAYDLETTNYKIYINKDSNISWRKYQIIHPVIYIYILKELYNSHEEILKRFNEMNKNSVVEVASIPIIPSKNKKQKGAQIEEWIANIEKKSIILSLSFEYLFNTDISNFYDSIYTHSIAWAFNNKDKIKKERNNYNYIGNRIDKLLQAMNNGQTNGIPTGSSLMDLIAEFLLKYVDFEFSKRINDYCKKDSSFKILRYRDDYRIFTKEYNLGEIIIKILSETLDEFGLKLNTSKSIYSNKIISSSIKNDKLEFVKLGINLENFKISSLCNILLRLHQLNSEYKNSGSILKFLNQIHQKLIKINLNLSDEEILLNLSLLIDIASKNPKTYEMVSAIISVLIRKKNDLFKKDIFKKINGKINIIPNHEILDLWLQRAFIDVDIDIANNSKLINAVIMAKKSKDNKLEVFDSSWITDNNIKDIVKNINIIDFKKLKHTIKKPQIEEEEINVFSYDFYVH